MSFFLQSLSRYVQELLVAIPNKHEAAQQDSLKDALLILSRWDIPGRKDLEKQARKLAAQLWPHMQETTNLWESEWKIVASPELLPFMRKAGLNVNNMRRFYEVAAQEARRSILRAAAHNDWETAAQWASVMPQEERPSAALDSRLARALRQTSDDDDFEANVDSTLFRRGGSSLIPRVRGMLASESCVDGPGLWAFLLKQEGAAAERSLLRRYREASADSSCEVDAWFQQIWVVYPLRYWSPRIQAIFTSQLDKTDSLAVVAVDLLRRFGGKDSENDLWARLEQWHRSPPLRPHDAQSMENEGDLEFALLTALLDGRNWTPERSRIDRLRQLCVYRCEVVKWARSTEQVQHLVISDWDNGHLGFLYVSYPMDFEGFTE